MSAPDYYLLDELLAARTDLHDIELRIGAAEARMGDPDVAADMRAMERVLAEHERLLDQYEQLGGSIVKIGQIVGFDDPILAPGYGVKGYWEPLTFAREVGICLLFSEAYDPAKTPVLFVPKPLPQRLTFSSSHPDPDRAMMPGDVATSRAVVAMREFSISVRSRNVPIPPRRRSRKPSIHLGR